MQYFRLLFFFAWILSTTSEMSKSIQERYFKEEGHHKDESHHDVILEKEKRKLRTRGSCIENCA